MFTPLVTLHHFSDLNWPRAEINLPRMNDMTLQNLKLLVHTYSKWRHNSEQTLWHLANQFLPNGLNFPQVNSEKRWKLKIIQEKSVQKSVKSCNYPETTVQLDQCYSQQPKSQPKTLNYYYSWNKRYLEILDLINCWGKTSRIAIGNNNNISTTIC